MACDVKIPEILKRKCPGPVMGRCTLGKGTGQFGGALSDRPMPVGADKQILVHVRVHGSPTSLLWF